jgi:hypothetical protein
MLSAAAWSSEKRGEPKVIRNSYMRIRQILDLITTKGLSAFFKEIIYIQRKAIIFTKDLDELKPKPSFSADIVELTSINIGECRFLSKYRRLKALNYTKNGYRGFGLVKNNIIIGDMWYYASDQDGSPVDINWLGLENWSDKFVYTFDIYIEPGERGNNIATKFQENVTYFLKNMGYHKAYTFCWADNFASLWTIRAANRWKEATTVTMNRILFLKTNAKKFPIAKLEK